MNNPAKPNNYDHTLPQYPAPSKQPLDAMKDFGKGTMGSTSHKVLGGGSVMPKVGGTSAQLHHATTGSLPSQTPSFAGSHSASQTPNAGMSPSVLTGSKKVQSGSVKKSSRSSIFHG